MGNKSMFIDLTRCTGCRGCQIACKQWKKLPAEKTRQWGSYQNPPDLSHQTLKIIRFTEAVVEDKLEWLFFPEQCRHCYDAPCKRESDKWDEKAVVQDLETGAVIFTQNIKNVPADKLRESCPYDIPRGFPDGDGGTKCDFCFDRITNNMIPSCVLTCPTGCMNYGEYDDMLALAKERLEEVRKDYPKAYLGDPKNTRIIYLYAVDHKLYYQD